jgi:hypothetical protein
MSGEMSLHTSLSNTAKEYAVQAKMLARNNPQPEAETTVEGETRNSGISWNSTEDGDVFITSGSDSASLKTSTVLTAKAVSALDVAIGLRQNLKHKFLGLYENAYSNSFSHNRLLASVGEWMQGNISALLSKLGVSGKEMGKLRKKIRRGMIEQNKGALSHIVYDETMLEIVT